MVRRPQTQRRDKGIRALVTPDLTDGRKLLEVQAGVGLVQ